MCKDIPINPLYAYLASPQTNPGFAGGISWNFNRFLVSPTREIVNRFNSRMAPGDRILVETIWKEIDQ